MESKQQNEKIYIKKEMIISEAVETYPEIVEALRETGVNCVGCHISSFETLEEGLAGHGGYSDKQIEEIIEMLNKLVRLERESNN